MAQVHKGWHTADLSNAGDEIVLFLIGMRINNRGNHPMVACLHRHGRMLSYLQQHPEKGLLGYRLGLLPTPVVIQYWRSFADLERFARDRDPHLESWRKFNRSVGESGDAGIWHETYRVPTASIDTIYGNMPATWLGAAVGLVPVARAGDTAAARLGVRDNEESIVPVT